MKYLCFSDLHCDKAAAKRLVKLAGEVDVVIGAGDFANQHRGILDTIDILSQIRKPSILVPGNGETTAELKSATANWESAKVLHGDGCKVESVSFWGVGGGIPITPFGSWSYDFDESQAEQLLDECPNNAILIVHSPPMDTVDHDSNGRIRGSQSIRQAIIDKSPKLVVCGHIHSDWGKRFQLGDSLILNAGPAGVIVSVD